jgi:drug/metabolite transporter (DMT)-like permease
MNGQAARLRLKTRFFTALTVLSSVCGDFSLTCGMRQVGRLVTFSPLAYLRAVLNPLVALGIALLIFWLFLHMALLSWADLSYVLPVTSIGYVLTALAGRLFLHEHVSAWRWSGILMIVAGVALVARTGAHRGAAT